MVKNGKSELCYSFACGKNFDCKTQTCYNCTRFTSIQLTPIIACVPKWFMPHPASGHGKPLWHGGVFSNSHIQSARIPKWVWVQEESLNLSHFQNNPCPLSITTPFCPSTALSCLLHDFPRLVGWSTSPCARMLWLPQGSTLRIPFHFDLSPV